MQLLDNKLIFSATDLSSFLGCSHLPLLSRLYAIGERDKPYFGEDPGLKVVQRRGLEHEHKYLDRLKKAPGFRVTDLTSHRGGKSIVALEQHAAATVTAMREGVDLVYQGALFDGTWLGYPDFLRRVERPSALGSWSYEVVDTKLAREAKAGALLQVILYAELLAAVQEAESEFVHLALGGPEAAIPKFRVKDYAAYFRSVKQRFLDTVAHPPVPTPAAVEPVAHCSLCDWDTVCTEERREVDHLDFVAGISRRHRRVLSQYGITTLKDLAVLDLSTRRKLDGLNAATLGRIHHQARLQYERRTSGNLRYDLLLPVVENRGLAALRPPSAGDLFFDLEGDPYAFETGIEYLFGLAGVDNEYLHRWSLDPAAEKATFEWFMDLVTERLEKFPDLHIYHYAAYEPTALKRLAVRYDASGSPQVAAFKRLAGKHDTRMEELDRLLRGQVFVDLYSVVRQSLRASVESYSIKKLEEFYQFQRQVDMRDANQALGNFEAWLNLGGGREGSEDLLKPIQDYNRDDVLSTRCLRDWLEDLRLELAQQSSAEVPRPAIPDPEPTREVSEKIKEVRDLMAQLLVGVPIEPAERTPEQQSRWLLAQMLEWHRREAKSMWWQYYEWRKMNEEQLLEDRYAIAGLEFIGEVGQVDRSVIHRYRFPPQEHAIKPGKDAKDPASEKNLKIIALDNGAHTLDIKRGRNKAVEHPRCLVPFESVRDDVLRESLLRIGRAVAQEGLSAETFPAALDLLQSLPPRVGQTQGEPLVRKDGNLLAEASRLVMALDNSVLPIQGPPGAGKSYSAARMIVTLIRAGRKVGITATSHKVIANLLTKVCEAADEIGYSITAIQKADEDQRCDAGQVTATGSNEEVLEGLTSGRFPLAAGTAWLWAREEMTDSVDVLFMDEAGQFSLANALAVAPAAKNLVLMGDPQQLEQPQQGLHPPGAEVSAMNHLLGGHATMPPDRGIFLDQTWRLHPAIAAFTSEVYYEDRLKSRPGLERQQLTWSMDETGVGLRWHPVEHQGNQNEAPEEVELVGRLVESILADGATWTDAGGKQHPITLDEILIVAPYNAQVAALAERLPAGARVGTVDKFQGQEAPVVIYSMATSTPEDAPRGLEFLYSPNRLNVATSRARCLVVLVANGRLLFPECRTPEQMKLANGLCRYLELATSVGSSNVIG